MPLKRQFVSIPVKIADGGRLLPDLPQGLIGPANFDEKVNFVSEIGEVRKRAGWDYPAPTSDWEGMDLDTFDATHACEGMRGVRRPNGTYAIVACGNGLIKAYKYSDGWVTLESDLATQADRGFRWWQIEDIAGYAIFNNAADLPRSWQIGDDAAIPLYEMREAGYASVGHICEYVDGVLMACDVVEITDDAMSDLMNSASPYRRVLDGWGNLLLRSQAFDNAAWTKTHETVSADAAVAPDGTMTADGITTTGTTVGHYVSQDAAIPANSLLTFSTYFKPTSLSTRGRLRFGDLTLVTSLVDAVFDTGANGGAGSVAATIISGAPTDVGATILSVGSGWYRITVTARLWNVESASCVIQMANAVGQYIFTGGGLTAHLLWGAQLEAAGEVGLYLATTSATRQGTQRVSFERIWSNIGNPTDFAVDVDGAIAASSKVLTLDWPMASFSAGDAIIVVGAGASGGNLETTIASIAGNVWTLTDAAATTVTDAIVSRPTDINSIAGYDQIEDDGSAILAQVVLKTQLMVFKASGHIWQSYYTGNVDEPFAKDRVTKKLGVAPRFPRAIVNITNDDNEEYLLFPGAKHFYRLDLGSQAPQQERLFKGAEKDLFFSRISGLGPYDVWAVDNACTDEMVFAYRWQDYESGDYNAARAIALKYAKDCESIAEISNFNFACAASVQKPLAGFACDEVEMWFLMGAGDGKVTLSGETNLAVLTGQRYGEDFEASLGGGLFSPAANSDNGAYVRRFSIDPANPDASRSIEVSIYSARATNDEPVLLETKTLTDPRFPSAMGLYYRKPFFKYRLTTDASDELRISGFSWRVSAADTQAIDRIN